MDKRERDRILRQIYDQNYTKVVSIILGLGGTREDVADIFQEALIVFIDNIQAFKFKGESQLNSYFCAIAKNLWKNELRRKGIQKKGSDNFLNKLNYNDNNEFEVVIKFQMYDVLFKLLDKSLDEDCINLLKELLINQESLSNITKKLKFKNNQVTSNKKYKCLQKLIKLMDQYPEFKEFLIENFRNE